MKEPDKTIYTIVSNAIGGSIAPEKLDKETKLSDLGITSMTFISILFEMESMLGVEVADAVEDIESLDSIEGLIDYVERKQVAN
ncbi:MAG: acyl carrier protein [Cyclobacteriaceae bacterium]